MMSIASDERELLVVTRLAAGLSNRSKAGGVRDEYGCRSPYKLQTAHEQGVSARDLR